MPGPHGPSSEHGSSRGDGSAESSEFYRRVMRRIPAALFAADRGWRLTYLNPRAEELLPPDLDDPIGLPVWEVFPELFKDDLARESQCALAEQHSVRFEEFIESTCSWWEIHLCPGRDELLFYARDISQDKINEARLRMFEAVVANANDTVLITETEPLDPPGPAIIYVNDAFTRVTGYAAEEVVGKSPRFLQGPQTDPATTALIRAALEKGEPVQAEVLNYKRDGTPFWAEMSIVPVFDARGDLLYFTSIQRDNTERREAQQTAVRLAREEAALAEATAAREQIETILESITDAFVAMDRHGTITYVNWRAAKNLNRPREDFIGENLWELFPELVDTRLFEEYERALRENTPASFEYYFARVNAWSYIHVHPTEQGLTCYIHDITARKRAEERQAFLSEASHLLASSLDYEDVLHTVASLPVQRYADVCIIELFEGSSEMSNVHIVSGDPTQAQLIELLKLYPLSLVRPEGPTQVLRTGKAELVDNVTEAWLESATQQEEHLDALRALRPRSIIVAPLRARDRVFGAMTLVESARSYGPHELELAGDLAGRAALAIDNARLYRESVRATRIRDEVLHTVAHDLRNPLAAISLNAESLLEDLKGGEADLLTKKALESIQRSIDRASRLIGDLLDVASLEAGKLSLVKRPRDCLALIAEALELHTPLAEKKSIRLEADLPEACPKVHVDYDRILQALANLIENAIKFTPEGGEVIIGAEVYPREVLFHVRDTGPGIDATGLLHLFEPFWQASKGAKKGAGLGLAIAKGLVEAHGGRIWARSEPDKGTTFSFTIPYS
ncbi:MAG: PAS domain S-box protein [Bradymonadaceae bacterium]